ncbi:hypothetical protein NDU88_003613 [Pleurodeles waltl]|uniref:Uncharacterized protein n=1 Tax=Pleurodeles waltl TaxID=8319 RepID=A0AAV7SGF7_PLEWA|nr:hypothetical protein NDU88_003613 [Pleurodeles waltl]
MFAVSLVLAENVKTRVRAAKVEEPHLRAGGTLLPRKVSSRPSSSLGQRKVDQEDTAVSENAEQHARKINMPTTEPQLPVISNSTNRETIKEADVSLATIIDYFMKRNSTLSLNRVQLPRSQLCAPRHAPPSLRNIVMNFDDKVASSEKREDWERDTFPEGRVSPVPSQYSLASSVRYQNRSKGRVKLHHGRDFPGDDDDQSVKSIQSVKSARNATESIARAKWTRDERRTHPPYYDPPLGPATAREGAEKLMITGFNICKASTDPFSLNHNRLSKKEQEKPCKRLLQPTPNREQKASAHSACDDVAFLVDDARRRK